MQAAGEENFSSTRVDTAGVEVAGDGRVDDLFRSVKVGGIQREFVPPEVCLR
jgi:hypothetical protein